jgi:Cof subfamily protein (haloacid dehalogenase superfamily)
MTTPPLPPGLAPGGRFAEWRPTSPAYGVIDVDGTLLGPSGEPTRAVLEAVDDAESAGLRLGFATGRMRAAVEPLGDILGLPGPHIFHNGALVRSDARTIASWELSPDSARTALELCSEHGWYAEVYVRDGYLVTDHRPEAVVHWHMLHQPPDGSAAELELETQAVLKITVAVFDGPAEPVVDAMSARGLHVGSATSPQAPGVTFVNVTEPGVDKGRALRAAAGHVDADLSEVVAIGDGANDLPMLAVAGTSIAMGHAAEEIRRAAHVVTEHLDGDGVAAALAACIAWRDGA